MKKIVQLTRPYKKNSSALTATEKNRLLLRYGEKIVRLRQKTHTPPPESLMVAPLVTPSYNGSEWDSQQR